MKFRAFHVNPGEKLKKKDVNNDFSNFMSVFPTNYTPIYQCNSSPKLNGNGGTNGNGKTKRTNKNHKNPNQHQPPTQKPQLQSMDALFFGNSSNNVSFI